MPGVTLDTGALIALEKGKKRMRTFLSVARADSVIVTVPVAVLCEWWRERTDVRDAILRAVIVEPMLDTLAKAVGEALGAVRGATMVDAIVMASAAQRGDVVLTSDPHDLSTLHRYFRGVARVLAV